MTILNANAAEWWPDQDPPNMLVCIRKVDVLCVAYIV